MKSFFFFVTDTSSPCTYRGKDKRQKRSVAIKIEPEHRGELNHSPNDPRRLVIEQQVLLALRKKPNIPMIYASGKTSKNYPYIVMQILGKNLTTLRKERPEPKFTFSTAFRIGEQVIHYHCTSIGFLLFLQQLMMNK
uniref:Tyrosine-protein phosphatase domain-containing protein n=1 Tax=Elaeophora elaphi TaxID=1147741 RepID=A0A0R3RHY8_9BILA